MAQFTTNYRLPLVSRDETVMTFLEWRTLVNGTEATSAMNMIDAELKTLEAKCNEAAVGFSFNSETGVLQLVKSDGTAITGSSVTIDLNNNYTKAEVNQLLEGYATKDQLSTALDNVNLTNYYTKEEIDTALENVASADNDYLTATAAAETYINKTDADANYLSKTDAESTYVSKTDAEGYLTKTEAQDTYVTTTQVEDMIEDASTGGQNIDLSTLATNSNIGLTEPRNTIQKINNAIDDINVAVQLAASDAANGFVSYTYNESTHELKFKKANDEETAAITLTGGGGSGVPVYSVMLQNNSSSTRIKTTQNSKCTLSYTYYLYFGSTVINQNGYLSVSYKGSQDANYKMISNNEEIASGVQQTLDVSDYLTPGNITVFHVEVNTEVNEDGKTKTKTAYIDYYVTCVEMSISTSFDSSSLYRGDVPIPYIPIGNDINKTVYLLLDDNKTPVISANIGKDHNKNNQLLIDSSKLSYGAHTATLYYVSDDATESNRVVFPILYDDESGNTDEMVGAYLENSNIKYGDKLVIHYVVYAPGKERMSKLNIAVGELNANGVFVPTYYSDVSTNIRCNRMETLELSEDTYPASGAAVVRLVTSDENGTAYMDFNVEAVAQKYETNQIETGLVYSYKPIGIKNDSVGKETYVYTLNKGTEKAVNIYADMTGFNWASDGYLESGALTLSGDARMTIDLPILYSSFENKDGKTVALDSSTNAHVTTTGRTIEIELSMNNVTDESENVVEYISDNGAQFVINPQVCYLLAKGQELELDEDGFIHNESDIPCAYLKDEKRLRISFVVQKIIPGAEHETQCVNVFVNGEYANSYLYPSTGMDYDGKAAIVIGSNGCITKLYDIRMYNRDLTDEEVLQNYMNSSTDIKERLAQNAYNDMIVNNDVSYRKAIYKYPCLLLIGNLSGYKGDEQPCGAVLTKPDNNGGFTTEFSCLDMDDSNVFACINNVQGTSSQQYIRKNYKVKLAKYDRDEEGKVKTVTDDEGKTSEVKKKIKYALKGLNADGTAKSVPESTLCYKIDYMSTDHANTFNANIADTLFNDKQPGSLVQNTVYGFRCLLFNMPLSKYKGEDFLNEAYSDSDFTFAGDGCLNNDKGNVESFGLKTAGDKGNVTKQQKWEFKTNSSDICKFKSDKFYEMIKDEKGNNILNVKHGLESCYPDEGDLEDDNLTPNYDYIHVLYTWICQRANFWEATDNATREAKKKIFKEEFTKHLNLEHALVYYLFMEFVCLCDNRAKNMFLSCKDVTVEDIKFTNGATSIAEIRKDDGSLNVDAIDWNNSTFAIWYADLYDLDSCFGVNNTGRLNIPYYADWDYHTSESEDSYVFSGHDSVFWKMFEEAFASEIAERAKTLTRQSNGIGYLSYATLHKTHIEDNADLVCPSVINRDMEYKYEDPITKGYIDYSDEKKPYVYTSKYKYLQRGSRTEQKESFMYKRSHLLYSKYLCDQFLNSYIFFRPGKDISMKNTAIELRPVQKMRMSVSYGDSKVTVSSDILDANEKTTIRYNKGLGTSDTVSIHGASDIVELGDISKFYPWNLDISAATRLKTITIGSSEEGYMNESLEAVNVTNNILLEKINISGCVNLQGVIDFTKNPYLKEVYASNTPKISGFNFADGCILETLDITSPSSIVFKNMTKLKTFKYASLNNVKTFIVENTPIIDSIGLLTTVVDEENGTQLIDQLENIRLTGVNADLGSDTAFLKKLLTLKGKYVDENGNKPQGSTAYPIITGTIAVDSIGSTLLSKLHEAYGDELVINYRNEPEEERLVTFLDWDDSTLNEQSLSQGDTPLDPVKDKLIDTPTRPETNVAEYTFVGWDRPITAVGNENESYKAVYSQKAKKYKVRWFNGTTLLQEGEYDYGEEAIYEKEIPTNTTGDSTGTYRLFKDWDKSTGSVVENIDVYPTWYEGKVPASGTPFADMTPMQIYAMGKAGILASNGGRNSDRTSAAYYEMIKSGDTTQISMGCDLDYANVTSHEIVADTVTFNGNDTTNIIKTDINLFDKDKPFTLMIDYNFDQTDTSGKATLVSCTNESDGFALVQTINGPRIEFGGDSFNLKSNNNNLTGRDIVVIRHILGDPTLYIYSADTRDITTNGSFDIRTGSISRDAAIINNSELAVGCRYYVSDGHEGNLAAGKVYKMKYWEGDLGDTACKKLACWPHEVYTFIASGLVDSNSNTNFRMYQKTGSTNYAGLNLYSKELFSSSCVMNAASTNVGGWRDTLMRRYLNERIYYCFDPAWRAIMSQVQIKSCPGSGNTNTVYESSDYVFIPSYAEIVSVSSTETMSWTNQECQGRISYFNGNTSRTKTKLGDSSNAYWWLRTPSTYINTSNNNDDRRSTDFLEVYYYGYAGNNWSSHANNTTNGFCFGFAI